MDKGDLVMFQKNNWLVLNNFRDLYPNLYVLNAGQNISVEWRRNLSMLDETNL